MFIPRTAVTSISPFTAQAGHFVHDDAVAADPDRLHRSPAATRAVPPRSDFVARHGGHMRRHAHAARLLFER